MQALFNVNKNSCKNLPKLRSLTYWNKIKCSCVKWHLKILRLGNFLGDTLVAIVYK